ncbi:quinone oxidoreductase-like protein 1 isoform X1 [Petromyzon marinus]|uniref:quinone oxidoreductase-like protein 1 isoform X1 n=1 Tax=Petromyzon marinus TaxID=7757 RepID=UPI003F71015D
MTASRHSPGLLFTTLYGAALRLTPWSESPFQHVTRARLGALGAGRVTWASLRSAGGRRSRDIPRSRRLHLHLSPDGAIGRPSLLPSTAPVMGGLFMDATGDRPRFFLHGKEQEEEVEEEEVVGKSTPGSREVDNHAVVVAVKACGLSPVPCALLARLKMQQSPQAVGREVAGMVAAVGALVTFFKPGDEVVGILPLDCTESGLAPRVTVHEHCLGETGALLWRDVNYLTCVEAERRGLRGGRCVRAGRHGGHSGAARPRRSRSGRARDGRGDLRGRGDLPVGSASWGKGGGSRGPWSGQRDPGPTVATICTGGGAGRGRRQPRGELPGGDGGARSRPRGGRWSASEQHRGGATRARLAAQARPAQRPRRRRPVGHHPRAAAAGPPRLRPAAAEGRQRSVPQRGAVEPLPDSPGAAPARLARRHGEALGWRVQAVRAPRGGPGPGGGGDDRGAGRALAAQTRRAALIMPGVGGVTGSAPRFAWR